MLRRSGDLGDLSTTPPILLLLEVLDKANPDPKNRMADTAIP